MKEQILSMGVQFIIGVVGIIGTFVLKKVADAVEVQKQALAAKKEATSYNRALSVAKGLYYVLEDEFKSLAKAGDAKRAEMEKRLLEIVPGLTQSELDAINKEVCNGAIKIGEGILTPIQVSQGTKENTAVAEDKTAQN
ncbi:hypothetical protein [Clostridium kluyveri]|uniref:Phage related protein n=2 Tax=Clostridium kluyveri TaxID=1534 RepID=A5F9L4_CLOK5|nr:hypothetical protein [Clostridium kluyveri]ABQ23648.1 phage related protein [Clostridium kluyveri DSM 555]BAH08528.1 hypothetical protein CKR_P09 [Clostridium kluyveri NBRC 12016]